MPLPPLSRVSFTRIDTEASRDVCEKLAEKCQNHAESNKGPETKLNRFDRDSMDCDIYAAPLYFPGEFLQAEWFETVLVRRIDEYSLANARGRFQQMLKEPQHDVILGADHSTPGYHCCLGFEGWPDEREWHLSAATFGKNDRSVADAFIEEIKRSELLGRYIPWDRLEVGGQQQVWGDFTGTRVGWGRPGTFDLLVKLESAEAAGELLLDCLAQLEFDICDLTVRSPIREVDESLQALRADDEPWHVLKLPFGEKPTCDILVPQKTTRPVFFPAIEYSDASSIYMNLFAVHTPDGMFLELQSTEPEFVDEVLSDLGLTSARHKGDPFTRWGIQWNEL